jgi:crotonobetainyl-CoA:carnitine CoA-transferase CaiB-like acyl-CoA transferase
MSETTPTQLVSGLRVLDLTDEKGLLCGKLLADMGADVILVEPPGGNPARNLAPFYKDQPGQDSSLFWLAYNTNKRSIILDLRQTDGQALFRRLVQHADVVLECFAPDTLAALGLGYDTLRQLNPRLILTSITPFGQSGPHKDYQAPDLVGMALGGFMHLAGDADKTPLRVGLPQAYLHAAAEAAAGTMVAYYARQHTGSGQHVDVSMQTCVIWTLMMASAYPLLHGEDLGRNGTFTRFGGKRLRTVYPCKDGYISFFAIGGAIGAHTMRQLLAWMDAEHMTPAFLHAIDWDRWDFAAMTQGDDAMQQDIDAIEQAVQTFFMTHTKQELYAHAIAHRMLLAPITDARDIIDDPQLAAREYFVPLYHAVLDDTLRLPGPFAKFSATPLQITRPAPRLGAHNAEVYGTELGLSRADMLALHQLGVIAPTPRAHAVAPRRVSVTPPSPPAAAPETLPFAGVRLVDFTWYGVGPLTTKYLADHGAEVIKIESLTRPDFVRFLPPWPDATPGLNRSQAFATLNTNKLSVSLNLAKPAARDLVKRLIATADAVVENFSPRAMPNWGLDYTSLQAIKPDLVMLSASQQGQTGPHAAFAGTGNLLAALCGFYQITGYKGGEPRPLHGAYTDFIVPRLASTALMAALDYRRRTGQGQYIDLSQLETSLHFLTPVLLDYAVNGRIAGRQGNRDSQAAPHGAYPCQGDDRWCAIAISTDAQWEAFCDILGRPAWTQRPAFATPLQRLRHVADLDQHVAAWTCTQEAHALMHRLQGAGVPAGVVARASDLHADPQLQKRGFFFDLAHPELGVTRYDGPQFHLSATPAVFNRPAPLLGQHNTYVLQELLGLSAADVARLVTAEVVK